MGLKLIFLTVSSAMSLLRLSRREEWWKDLMTVLREYEDFYNTHRPHRTLNQAAPLCPMASPTWTTSASSGATAPEA